MTETRTPDTRLESRDNPLLKLTRAVRDGRERNLILIEGVRLCEEAAHAGVHVEALLYTDHVLQDKGSSQLLSALRSKAARAHVVTASLLSSVSDTKTPQGLVVLAKRPLSEAVSLERRLITGVPLLLILHGVGNPLTPAAFYGWQRAPAPAA
ncbi:MAG: RNA methyltransferase substrate-binding domain-containing protein [Pyrinomonadaceae bacterium]